MARFAASSGCSGCSSSATAPATSRPSRPRTSSLLGTFAGHARVVLENNRLEQSLAEVTELKEQLHHQVLHDHLTGLPNRVAFAQAVDTRSSPKRAKDRAVDSRHLPRPRRLQGRQRHPGPRRRRRTAGAGRGEARGRLRPGDTPSSARGRRVCRGPRPRRRRGGASHWPSASSRHSSGRTGSADQEIVPRASLGIALATEGVGDGRS